MRDKGQHARTQRAGVILDFRILFSERSKIQKAVLWKKKGTAFRKELTKARDELGHSAAGSVLKGFPAQVALHVNFAAGSLDRRKRETAWSQTGMMARTQVLNMRFLEQALDEFEKVKRRDT